MIGNGPTQIRNWAPPIIPTPLASDSPWGFPDMTRISNRDLPLLPIEAILVAEADLPASKTYLTSKE